MKVELLHQAVDASQIGEHAALPGVPVVKPKDVEQARELFALAARDTLRMAFLGSGSKLGWSVMSARPDFAISTLALAGITDFEAGDGTITALAGSNMADLQRTVGKAGLAVTPDVPRPDQATLGGTIAAAANGADRLVFGPGRLHVLGTRVLQLDGNRTRSGGNLVKNVTGYDLQRLYTGSFGSVALVVEASLRLVAEPAAAIVVSKTSRGLETALELASSVLAAQVSPRSVAIESGPTAGEFQLHVVLSGLSEHVELELERVRALLGETQDARGAEADEMRLRLRDLEPDSRTESAWHVTTRASELRPTLGELFDAIGPHEGTRLLIHPGLATIDMTSTSEDDESAISTLSNLRKALTALGAHATMRGARPLSPAFAEQDLDPLRSGLARRLRVAYDPNNLLCTRPPLGGLL